MGNENLGKELSINWNFVIVYDILTDVYDIFISKQVEGDSFNLICRHYVPKRGCHKFYKQFFNIIKFWVQESGTIGQLIYSVRLFHGATSWEKFVVACFFWKIIYGKLSKELKNGIEILVSQAVFKLWIKTVKISVWSNSITAWPT